MSRPRISPLCWPQAIPRNQRLDTDDRRCFCLRRHPGSETELFTDHELELTGNLLAVAARGQIILRRSEEVIVLHEGDACLLQAGSLSVTEIPARALGGTDFFYLFFSDRVVRQRFTDLAGIERLSLAMSSVSTELRRLPNFLPQLLSGMRTAGFSFPGDATKVLNFTFNHGWAGAWMFLKSFFARLLLHLFLEEHVYPIETPENIERAYPGGKSRFQRDFRDQYDVSLQRWLIWRRLQIARLILRHGRPMPVHHIAAAMGFSNFQVFRHQFRSRFRLWPEEVPRRNDYDALSSTQLTSILAPFWHWSHCDLSKAIDAAAVVMKRAQDKQLPRWRRLRLRRLEREFCYSHVPSEIRHEDMDSAPGANH